MWVLHSGQVDLWFSDSRGSLKALRVVDAPGTLCVSDILGGRALDCAAVTETACVLGFIDKAKFLPMLADAPSVRIAVLQTQSDELTACYDCMRRIGSTQRLARRDVDCSP